MSKDFCQGCGHHFPSKEEGVVKCPHCGRPAQLHDKAQCPSCGNLSARGTKFCAECSSALFKLCSQCGKSGPTDAGFCVECGSALLDHKTYLARQESEQEGQERQGRAVQARKGLAVLIVMGAFLAAVWFFCIAPVIGWVEKNGDGSLIQAVQLSQAQIEATRQAEIAARTAAFEDINVRVGEITDLERREGGHLNVTFPIIIENTGDSSHDVLIAYDGQTIAFSSDWNTHQLTYLEVVVGPHSHSEVSVTRRIQDYTRGAYLWVRLESIDGVPRSDTSLEPNAWDWEFEIYDK